MQLYWPWALLLILLLPGLVYLLLLKKLAATVRFPSFTDIKKCSVSWRIRFRPALIVLRMLCLFLLIIALARPRKGTVLSQLSTEGVAIEAVVDHSSSMQAEMDYFGDKLNRLEVVKKVLTDFVEGSSGDMSGRAGDLIGLVTFARYADTICPLVLSHDVVAEFLKKEEIVQYRSEDGTAIGDAIALAAARLKTAEDELNKRNAWLRGAENSSAQQEPDFKIKSKAIILLTDGQNNTGQYNPLDAADLAKQWGIKIYTIGIGSAGAYTVVQTLFGSYRVPVEQDLDEQLLKAIAEKTGGFYGRADDAKALREIVKHIDELEKSKVEAFQYTQFAEHFDKWAFPALVILALEMLASCTVFRKIP